MRPARSLLCFALGLAAVASIDVLESEYHNDPLDGTVESESNTPSVLPALPVSPTKTAQSAKGASGTQNWKSDYRNRQYDGLPRSKTQHSKIQQSKTRQSRIAAPTPPLVETPPAVKFSQANSEPVLDSAIPIGQEPVTAADGTRPSIPNTDKIAQMDGHRPGQEAQYEYDRFAGMNSRSNQTTGDGRPPLNVQAVANQTTDDRPPMNSLSVEPAKMIPNGPEYDKFREMKPAVAYSGLDVEIK